MARSKVRKEEPENAEMGSIVTQLMTGPRTYDQALATLFETSLRPLQAVARSVTRPVEFSKTHIRVQSPGTLGEAESTEDKAESDAEKVLNDSTAKGGGKRKRKEVENDVEGRYLNQLVREEVVEEQRRNMKVHNKRQKSSASELSQVRGDKSSNHDPDAPSTDGVSGNEDEESLDDVPQHESIITSKEGLDLEKSSRTVFLANVSTLAIKSKSAKRTLLEHLASCTPSLSQQDVRHGIESLRFRSTAFASSAVPKKAAYAKRELMDATTQSTNAYAVYTTQLAARHATKDLNGSIVLDRHLRVDSVAHPAKIDHRRCVFVGNLGFVDDETNIVAAEDREHSKPRRKAKERADVEEGLWRQFKKAGAVESVRVVRDKNTRVGKGFAYVQFVDANAVEKALLFNEKKFPPMLPRILRVTRAKDPKKAGNQNESKPSFKRKSVSKASYTPKVPSQVQSLRGRAAKLFGRAGAAQVNAATEGRDPLKATGVAKSPESVVFEGYRATRPQGKGLLGMRDSGKSKRKPRTRSSRRGSEFKAKGRKKART